MKIDDKVHLIAETIDPTAFDQWTKFVRVGKYDEGVMRRKTAILKAEEILKMIEAWSVQG